MGPGSPTSPDGAKGSKGRGAKGGGKLQEIFSSRVELTERPDKEELIWEEGTGGTWPGLDLAREGVQYTSDDLDRVRSELLYPGTAGSRRRRTMLLPRRGPCFHPWEPRVGGCGLWAVRTPRADGELVGGRRSALRSR